MNAHKAIETIDLLLSGAIAKSNAEFSAYITELRKNIESAVKFKFPQWEMPEQFRANYTPLPFDKCYYEMLYENGDVVALVLTQESKGKIQGEILQKSPLGIEPQALTFKAWNENGSIRFEGKNALRSLSLYSEKEGGEKLNFAVQSMIGFNQIMACSNIEYEEHAAPKRLNEKRKKKNKPPLFSYKTLKIACGERTEQQRNGEPIGDRAGPRIHLRRGHIRTLQSGKTTWVQPCVVGDKKRGMVVKDYHVSQEGT